jgi:hypothetical protein
VALDLECTPIPLHQQDPLAQSKASKQQARGVQLELDVHLLELTLWSI